MGPSPTIKDSIRSKLSSNGPKFRGETFNNRNISICLIYLHDQELKKWTFYPYYNQKPEHTQFYTLIYISRIVSRTGYHFIGYLHPNTNKNDITTGIRNVLEQYYA